MSPVIYVAILCGSVLVLAAARWMWHYGTHERIGRELRVAWFEHEKLNAALMAEVARIAVNNPDAAEAFTAIRNCCYRNGWPISQMEFFEMLGIDFDALANDGTH